MFEQMLTAVISNTEKHIKMNSLAFRGFTSGKTRYHILNNKS